MTLGANTLTINNGADTFAGIISGTGGLTVTGGKQTLSGMNMSELFEKIKGIRNGDATDESIKPVK